MTDRVLPHYPIYIPSKGRFHACQTAQCLSQYKVPFYLVVEPQEEALYRVKFPTAHFLVLPWSGDDQIRRDFCQQRGIENGGLIAVRNWMKEHSISLGTERHWQLDDNIRHFYRRYRAKRVYCDPALALRVCEDFTDRYENIAISGLNYKMFCPDYQRLQPIRINCHVYSCTLVLNSTPFRWRLAYNDDTDMCLQVLAAGWCTLQINTFLCDKITTMLVKGGNTTDLYQGDGRLKMARSLERMWPGVVTTDRRYHRPQHVVKDSWKRFDTPLKLKPGIDLSQLPAINEYDMELTQVNDEIKSPSLRGLFEDWHYKKEKEASYDTRA